MNKLTNAVVFIIIGLVFATVVVSSVSTYQYNANGWDNDTRETVRGSGVYYSDLLETNDLTNGFFSSGTTGWTVEELATFTVTNGIATMDSEANGSVYQLYDFDVNHKYYVNVLYKSTGQFNIWNPYNSSWGVVAATSSDYVNIDTDFTVTFNFDKFQIRNTSGDDAIIYIDYIVLIDITELYGVGNEPTSGAMHTWYMDALNLSENPDNTLKTLDGMVDFIPILFIIIVVAGAVLFIKTKES